MNVNGVTSTQKVDTYQTKGSGTTNQTPDKAVTDKPANNTGVVYEPSKQPVNKTYKPDPKLIAKLQADADNRTAQLRSLVEQMMSKQGNKIGQADDMWKFLAGGNFTVDAATKAQAQADIGEEGYWGVSQTSDRIVDFAKALTGGDPNKMEEMKKAFEKGFKQATGTWGKSLPDISSETYDATMKKFDDWGKEANTDSATI